MNNKKGSNLNQTNFYKAIFHTLTYVGNIDSIRSLATGVGFFV